ncbi:MAG TPA: hypothetical protein VMH26_06800 [Burkholderiales bacterium]|nr:hypothetical protein [Burkholderiales bacterium]
MSQDIAPEHRKLEGNVAHEEALDILFARPGRQLRIFDRQLSTGYNSAQRYDLLRHFLLASRSNRIQIVLHDTSDLQRDCPRLINLLRQFSYAVAIQETEPQAKGVYDPFAVLDERDYVHRFHYDDTRGLLGLDDPHEARGFVQRFEEIWEASSPAVSATTLGL